MYVELTKVNQEHKLCFVHVSRVEALELIRSLTNQMIMNTPNAGRLESTCKGAATEFTIAVIN